MTNSLVVPKHFFYSVQTFKGPVSSQALNSLLQGQVHGPTTAPITVSVSTSMVIPNSTVINHDTYMPFYSCIKYDIHCTYNNVKPLCVFVHRSCLYMYIYELRKFFNDSYEKLFICFHRIFLRRPGSPRFNSLSMQNLVKFQEKLRLKGT